MSNIILRLLLELVIFNMVWNLDPSIFPPNKYYCWLGGGYFLSYRNRDYTDISHSNKDKYYFNCLRGGKILLVFVVMVEWCCS